MKAVRGGDKKAAEGRAAEAVPRDLLRACVPHCSPDQRDTIRNRITSCQ
jgi:DNA topoisomerase 2-associated protein PAT1